MRFVFNNSVLRCSASVCMSSSSVLFASVCVSSSSVLHAFIVHSAFVLRPFLKHSPFVDHEFSFHFAFAFMLNGNGTGTFMTATVHAPPVQRVGLVHPLPKLMTAPTPIMEGTYYCCPNSDCMPSLHTQRTIAKTQPHPGTFSCCIQTFRYCSQGRMWSSDTQCVGTAAPMA